MLLARVLTAVAAVAVLIPIIIYGGLIGVASLVAAISAVGSWELCRNFSAVKQFPSNIITLALGVFIVIALTCLPQRAVFAVVVWFPLSVVVLHLFLYDVIENTLESVTQMIFVPAYAVIPLAHAVLLARLPLGIPWIFFVLVVVCFGDIAAYFTGKFYGKRRFSARVSPAKTVEGLGGGLAGNLLGLMVMKSICPDLGTLYTLLVLTLLLAPIAVIGDLSASAIKRRLNIKDYGSILPGHGGVMDRADSLILAFPAVYHFLVISGCAVPS